MATMDPIDRFFEILAEAGLDGEQEDRAVLEAAGLDPDELIERGQTLVRKIFAKQLGTLCSPAGGIARHSTQVASIPDSDTKIESDSAPSNARPNLSEELELTDAGKVKVVLAIERCLRVERAEFDRVVGELNGLSSMPRIDILPLVQASGEGLSTGKSLFVGVLGWNRCGLAPATAVQNTPTGHPCSAAVAHWADLDFPPALFLHRIGTAQYADTELQDEMLAIDEYIRGQSSRNPAVIRTFSNEEEFSRLIREALGPGSAGSGDPFSTEFPADEQGVIARLKSNAAMVERDGILVREVLRPQEDSSGSCLGAASRRLDDLYSVLGETGRQVKFVVCDRPNHRTDSLAAALRQLLEKESTLWSDLNHLRYAEGDSSAESVGALLTAFSGRRSALRAGLRWCLADPITRSEGASGEDAAFEVARRRFLETDDLDVESRWRDLLRYGKHLWPFLDKADQGGAEAIRLRESMWQLLDFVIVEDLASLGLQRCPEDLERLQTFRLMVACCGQDRRFKAVWRALEKGVAPRPELCEVAFLDSDVDATAHDIEVMLRVLLIATPDEVERDSAARHIAMRSLWSIVAYNQVPWRVLKAICSRIRASESQRYGKAFFDAIHSRIRDAVRSAVGEGAAISAAAEPEAVKDDLVALVTELFQFDFFVETGYYERIERLVKQLSQNSGSRRDPLHQLLEIYRTRDDEQEKPVLGDRRACEPLDGLPLGVHRYLAGEPSHVFRYIAHEDPRIAEVALAHVGRGNILKVLQDRRIHRIIMHRLLQRRDLFASLPVVVAALRHPKCTGRFAMEHLGRIPIEEVRKLAWSHEINADVKTAASALVHRRIAVIRQQGNTFGARRGYGA